jgi:putative tributyrin esterase
MTDRLVRPPPGRRACALALLSVVLCAQGARAQATLPSRTVQFESRLAGRAMPYGVVLPAGYARDAARGRRFPVLYLLHGLYGSHADWLSKTRLATYAAEHRLIVVTPEGGNGWYTDSATVELDRYESYIIRELIPEVERRFSAERSRGGRAVAGLSMGGYGALKFGIKYPDMFALAASMSGAVGAASWQSEDELPGGLFRASVVRTFGPPGGATKAENDLFRLVAGLGPEEAARLPFLYLDCGTEDGLRLLPQNRALADLLVARKVAHEYRQLPGDHNWAYWDRQVREVLRLASARLSAGGRAAERHARDVTDASTRATRLARARASSSARVRAAAARVRASAARVRARVTRTRAAHVVRPPARLARQTLRRAVSPPGARRTPPAGTRSLADFPTASLQRRPG